MIVISYRRADSAGFTRALHERLVRELGSEQVFLDVDVIEAGADFHEVLREVVSRCDALLVVIGPRWLAPREGGGSRLDEADDVVRMEIATALASGVRIVPVLVDGAPMPPPAALPAEIRALSAFSALALSNERFEADLQRLLRVLGIGAPRVAATLVLLAVLAGAGAYILLAVPWRFFAEGLIGVALASGAGILLALRRGRLLPGRTGRIVGAGGSLAMVALILLGGLAVRGFQQAEPFTLTVRVHDGADGDGIITRGGLRLELDGRQLQRRIDENGEARFEAIPRRYAGAEARLFPLVPGYDTLPLSFAVSPENVVTLALDRARFRTAVRGTVVDGAGRPMPGVVLDFGSGQAVATSDAGGNFTVTIPVAPGAVLPLLATRDGSVGYHDAVVIPERTPLTVRFTPGG